MEIKDKKMKKGILKELMKQMGNRVADNDFKPKEGKTKMVIEAEGDSPEEIKEEVIEKLQTLELPSKKDMKEMGAESEEEEEEEDEDDFMSELPEGMRKALMKKLDKE